MSEDYNKFDEIPPFTVNTDPSIVLNDEDCPWLRRNQKKGTHTKKHQMGMLVMTELPNFNYCVHGQGLHLFCCDNTNFQENGTII